MNARRRRRPIDQRTPMCLAFARRRFRRLALCNVQMRTHHPQGAAVWRTLDDRAAIENPDEMTVAMARPDFKLEVDARRV